MAKAFLEGCFKEDGCSYLIDVLLECTDQPVRQHVGNLLKQVVNKLKESEADKILLRETIEVADAANGQVTTTE
jgi:ATP-dependent protease HslVU (ClpYQ) peptidase subunit